MKILIVDDEPKRAANLGAYLRQELIDSQVDVFFATCVDSAKNLLRAIYFDALVLDVVLPKRDHEQASASNGLQLLSQLHRTSFLKKPERIVGITANLEDIASYRENFEECCAVVVEARDLSDGWKAKIRNSLSYTFSSKFSRDRADENAVIFTIHGIRTYGEWQDRLKKLVETHTDRITFFNYKYGYFSTIFFLVPALRLLEVRRLQKRILPILETVKGKKVYIFCHSFGTWLATKALRHILKSRALETELVVVLSGSVLPSNFDWSFIRGNPSIRVVNECGTRDYVLWMCNAFALGLGMAGKCGFNGFNDRRFINRYYDGGHSLYFQSDGFMRSYWLPLISEPAPGADVDMRSPDAKVHMLAEGLVRAMGRIKPYAYCLGACLVGYFILSY